MREELDKVMEFHKTYDCHIATIPATFASQDVRDVRIRILKEEWEEYLEAEESNDIVEVADALGDMLYIILGTAISYGIPLGRVFDEIHDSNMSKLGEDGKPIYRGDGKVLKGPNFRPPIIIDILDDVRRYGLNTL